MKKKALATIVCMAMVLGTLTGCGGGSADATQAETSEAADTQIESTESEAAGEEATEATTGTVIDNCV